MSQNGNVATASSPDILGLIEAMKQHLPAHPADPRHRPIVKARPRTPTCGTCRGVQRVHYVQDSGTGGYDLEPGGHIPCPDCGDSDESAEALERASFR